MKEAVNDVFKLVKNEGNLIFNFENAVDKVASHHNVNKDDLEEYFDLEVFAITDTTLSLNYYPTEYSKKDKEQGVHPKRLKRQKCMGG